MPLVYQDLRRRAAVALRPEHTLAPTALVHEASAFDSDKASLVELPCFTGLTIEETAADAIRETVVVR